MKTIVLALAFFAVSLSTISYADVISCSFTEPFFDTVYDMSKQTLTVIAPDDGSKKASKVFKNVSFQINGPGSFSIVGPDKKVIQILNLTNRGSDGMSNFIFPYEVKWLSLHGNNVGGCESSQLKATNSGN